MARGIKVNITTSRFIYNRIDGVRVFVEAVENCEMPRNIFAYRAIQSSADPTMEEGHFSHICSTTDLVEYPVDSPTPGSQPRWFRLNYVDLIVRSWAEALDLLDVIRSDIGMLVRSLNTMDQAISLQSIQIGASCPDPDSESSSSDSDIPSVGSESSSSASDESSSQSSTSSSVDADSDFLVFNLFNDLFDDTILEIDPLFTIDEVV